MNIRRSMPVCAMLFFLIAFTGLYGCKRSEKEKASIMEDLPAEVGGAAAPFTIKTFAGDKISLEKLKGKVVVINFFASWCGPCRDEAPSLQRLYLKYRDSGVEFVGIAVQDSVDGATGFVKRYGWTLPAGLDENGDIADAYKVLGVPKTCVIGKDGHVLYAHTGTISEEGLDEEIKKAL